MIWCAEVWEAVCGAVRDAVRDAGIDPSQVCGIAFDATCSLYVLPCSWTRWQAITTRFTMILQHSAELCSAGQLVAHGCESVKGYIDSMNERMWNDSSFVCQTCRVVVDDQGRPVSVTPMTDDESASENGTDERNIIVWLDHRATREADIINSTSIH